jgi:hypothetical protein
MMMKTFLQMSCLGAAFALASSMAVAQEIVHALSGTVTSVNAKIRMIEIDTDDGSSGHFEWVKKSGGEVDFDKSVKADATAVDQFTGKGDHVIVYYTGQGQIRTAVAVHDLGNVTVEKIDGTVVKLNRHDHTLTIKNGAGAEQTIHLDAKTVGDTATGVAKDLKFDFSKGDTVRVTAVQDNGGETALLITPAM